MRTVVPRTVVVVAVLSVVVSSQCSTL